eukprot:gene13489-9296_t
MLFLLCFLFCFGLVWFLRLTVQLNIDHHHHHLTLHRIDSTGSTAATSYG